MNAKWIRFELLGTALLLIVMGSMNPVRYVAEVKPPTVNDRVDYTYLSRLGSDGAAGWVSSYQWVRETLQSEAYQQPVIEAAARKDLLYMPVIIRNTLYNKLRLLDKYGDAEQKKASALLLMNYSQQEVEAALLSISKAKDLAKSELPAGTTLSPVDQAVRTHYGESKYFDELLAHETSLLNLKSQLASGSAYLANEKYDEASFSTTLFGTTSRAVEPETLSTVGQETNQRYLFTPTNCQHLLVCMPSDSPQQYISAIPNSWLGWLGLPITQHYNPESRLVVDAVEPLTEWEKYVSTNPADKAAHELLEKEVPLAELLEMERAYFKSYVKAGRQEQVDRTVDLDIDMDVPFLDPVYTYSQSYYGY